MTMQSKTYKTRPNAKKPKPKASQGFVVQHNANTIEKQERLIRLSNAHQMSMEEYQAALAHDALHAHDYRPKGE